MKFLKGDKVYDFKGNRVLEKLTEFIESGYAKNSGSDIPILLTDWEKLMKDPHGEMEVHYRGAMKDVNK